MSRQAVTALLCKLIFGLVWCTSCEYYIHVLCPTLSTWRPSLGHFVHNPYALDTCRNDATFVIKVSCTWTKLAPSYCNRWIPVTSSRISPRPLACQLSRVWQVTIPTSEMRNHNLWLYLARRPEVFWLNGICVLLSILMYWARRKIRYVKTWRLTHRNWEILPYSDAKYACSYCFRRFHFITISDVCVHSYTHTKSWFLYQSLEYTSCFAILQLVSSLVCAALDWHLGPTSLVCHLNR